MTGYLPFTLKIFFLNLSNASFLLIASFEGFVDT